MRSFEIVLAVAAVITGVVAPPPEKPVAPPPPAPAPPKESKGYRHRSIEPTNPFLALAMAGPEKMVEGNAFDKAYNLPKGSMMNCLDAVFHGEKPSALEIGNDFVVVSHAPNACTSILKEVSERPENKDLEDDDKIATIQGDSIRLNGFTQNEVEFLATMDQTLFTVRRI